MQRAVRIQKNAALEVAIEAGRSKAGQACYCACPVFGL
jgi:hypothetical protein